MLDHVRPEPSQGQGAYARLLDDIRAGRLGPGDRLTENELAERLGVSRTPVREAIRQLEADGLVAHVPRVGATVRRLEYAEVMELYDMRTVLEGTAARMAAQAASALEIAELKEINAELATARLDAPQAFRLNRQFHFTLLDAAKNRFLIKSMNALQKTLLILGPSTLEETVRIDAAVAEHDWVLDALERRDPVAAEATMRAHIEAAHRVRLRQFRKRERPLEAD